MTDEEILAWINARTPEASYYDHELRRLIRLVGELPSRARICEIGVYGGRTAAVYMLERARRYYEWNRGPGAGQPDYSGTHKEADWWASQHGFDLHLIDAWVLNESESRPGFAALSAEIEKMLPLSHMYSGHWTISREAAAHVPAPLDLLHIDGDHREGAFDDCRLYLPKVRVGGVVVVHDYGKPDEYPMVTQAVDQYLGPALDASKREDDFEIGDVIISEPDRMRGTAWKQLGVVGSQYVAQRVR